MSQLFVWYLPFHSSISASFHLITNSTNPPCLLTRYDSPWLHGFRYKPAAADNAPDGDSPSLPHKQDAQPWGETPFPFPRWPPSSARVGGRGRAVSCQLDVCLQTNSVRLPFPTNSLTTTLCCRSTSSLFPFWLTMPVTAMPFRVLSWCSSCCTGD